MRIKPSEHTASGRTANSMLSKAIAETYPLLRDLVHIRRFYYFISHITYRISAQGFGHKKNEVYLVGFVGYYITSSLIVSKICLRTIFTIFQKLFKLLK